MLWYVSVGTVPLRVVRVMRTTGEQLNMLHRRDACSAHLDELPTRCGPLVQSGCFVLIQAERMR
jgi:hypothetical protein